MIIIIKMMIITIVLHLLLMQMIQVFRYKHGSETTPLLDQTTDQYGQTGSYGRWFTSNNNNNNISNFLVHSFPTWWTENMKLQRKLHWAIFLDHPVLHTWHMHMDKLLAIHNLVNSYKIIKLSNSPIFSLCFKLISPYCLSSSFACINIINAHLKGQTDSKIKLMNENIPLGDTSHINEEKTIQNAILHILLHTALLHVERGSSYVCWVMGSWTRLDDNP